MGIVEWFLGVHFSWRITPSSVDVHLNQSGFAANLVERFARQSRNATPTATPYRSGVPIDSIAPSLDADDSPAQIRRKEAYQSLVGSLGWLSSTTRPDIAAAHSFLSSYTYTNKPASGHMRRPSTFFTTFIPLMITAYPTHQRILPQCIHTFTTLRLPMLRRTTMLSLHPWAPPTPSLHTAMHVGVPNLAALSPMAFFFRSSNSAA